MRPSVGRSGLVPKKKMWVDWDDDAHLSQSRKNPGDFSPLTRDDVGNLFGHVTLSDIEEGDEPSPSSSSGDFDSYDGDGCEPEQRSYRPDELSPAAQAAVDFASQVAAAVLVHLIDRAIDAAKPRVRRWWDGRALPAIKSLADAARSTAARRRTVDNPAELLDAMADGAVADTPEVFAVPTEEPSSVEADIPDSARPTMSRDEAYQRLCAAVAARAFADEQLQRLLSSQIDDTGHFHGGEGWVEQFSPTDLADSVKAIEANPVLVDDVLALLARQAANSPLALPPATHEARPSPSP